MTVPVIVVGDLVADVVVHPLGPIAADTDTPARVRVRGGGSAANTAAWLAHAGAAVTLIARIGDDDTGMALATELRGHGVSLAPAVDRDTPTGTIVVLVASDGSRTMLTDRGAAARLVPGDLAGAVFAAPGHLHLSGYALLGTESRDGALAALERAREAEMTVSVGPGTIAPLREAGPRRFLGWTSRADWCLANREEAAALLDVDPGRPAGLLATGLARHYRHAVVTLGPGGAVYAGEDGSHTQPAVAASVRDTTGAGDALAAGLLAAWLDGAVPAEALQQGCRLAAAAVAVDGGRPPRDQHHPRHPTEGT